MSQITLKPLDDGQKAVEIPLGKTTIGRGPLLGCSDKKVSRNHAVLEVTSKGEVFLTPTHVNPCFYQPTADSPGQILKKDVPHKLENGDSFSLLPRAYRYQLIVGVEDSRSESTDLNDIDKQVGKTNGSVTDHHDGPTSNEELGDTIVPEKAFNKEEISNTEKNGSKEDNTFSKRILEIKDNDSCDFSKDVEENNTRESTEKNRATSTENNHSAIQSPTLPVECKEDSKESCDKEETTQTVRTESELKNSNSEECVETENKLATIADKKTIEKSDSTSEPDSSQRNIVKDKEKSEAKTSLITPEDKVSDSEPLPHVEPEIEDSYDYSSNEAGLTLATSDKIDEPDISTKATKKTIALKKPQKEKQAPKRKTENSPKPRGRKKTKKTNFDDSMEGTSRLPGRTSSRTNRQTRQGLSLEDFIVSDDDEWQSDRSEPKRRRKRGNKGKRGNDSGSDWEIEHKKPKKPLHKVWSGSESGSEQTTSWPKGTKGRGIKKVYEVEPEEKSPQPSSSSEINSNKSRIPCTYGKKCFRRNMNHKDQFSHPGDSDYASETETKPKNNDAISESEDETPKKECPFGVNCFRKNPQHKKDFKHSKKVRPQREAAKQADKRAKNSRNSDEVDSYDLNDSFLNDDSDEYKPLDSGSDYESGEKSKRLMKVKGNRSKKGRKV